MDRITVSDAELVEASRRGERAAFGELVARYQRVVCAVGYCGTNDRSLGEDIAQDTFVAAFHQLDQLRDVSRLRSWLCGIARNLARKAKRTRDREDVLDEAQPDSAASPFDAASERERDLVVSKALERVPETYREALVLYYVEQHSVAAVADALGISADAVHQRLSRGRQLVAAEVAELVEHTLERRRTRRNLVAAVIAALPASVIPAHAHAANASGGSNMLRIGIAAALTATIAGTGYAVHRARAEHAATSAGSLAAAATTSVPSRSSGASLPWARRAHTSHAVTAPPALPSTTGHVVNDCAAVARHLGSLAPQMVSSTTSITMSRDQVEKLRAALGSGQMFVVEGSGELPGSDGLQMELGNNLEQQCKDEHWSQSLIDCFASVPDLFSTGECSTGTPPGIASPTADQLAAVTDTSCKAVAAHVASTITVRVPLVDGVPATVIGAMNDQVTGVADQIASQCDDDGWAESLRRCLAASASAEMMATCH